MKTFNRVMLFAYIGLSLAYFIAYAIVGFHPLAVVLHVLVILKAIMYYLQYKEYEKSERKVEED